MQEMDEISKSKAIEEERMALRKQMDLEQKERQDIENLKEEEKEQAEAEVYKTFAEMEKKREQVRKGYCEERSPVGTKRRAILSTLY